MDLCAPCPCYLRADWGRNLALEDCCLNCACLEAEAPCDVLARRIYPNGPATRPVRGGGPRSVLYPCTAACGDSADGRGGDS